MAACLFVVLIVTSQQPQQQTDTWGEIKRRVGDIAWYEAETRAKTTASMGKVFSPGGGFGPVDEDGYGVRCVCVCVMCVSCVCVCTHGGHPFSLPLLHAVLGAATWLLVRTSFTSILAASEPVLRATGSASNRRSSRRLPICATSLPPPSLLAMCVLTLTSCATRMPQH